MSSNAFGCAVLPLLASNAALSLTFELKSIAGAFPDALGFDALDTPPPSATVLGCSDCPCCPPDPCWPKILDCC